MTLLLRRKRRITAPNTIAAKLFERPRKNGPLLLTVVCLISFTASAWADDDMLAAPSPGDVEASSPAAARAGDVPPTPQGTPAIVSRNAFSLKKWNDAPAAFVVPASAENAPSRLPDGANALAGLRAPGAFQSAHAATIDRDVIPTGGEYAPAPANTALLPTPPRTTLQGDPLAPLPVRPQMDAAPAVSPLPQPDSVAPNDQSGDYQIPREKCRSPRSLKSIRDISPDINVKHTDLTGSEGKSLPPECSLGDEATEPRHWQPMTFAWTAAATCHKPIYFDDDQLERYGHTYGPVAQTTVSAVKFFATVPLVPYYMGVYPPEECIYDLGVYRPGSCAPHYEDPFPLSVRGAINEGLLLGILPAL